jgi:hypothetical protein
MSQRGFVALLAWYRARSRLRCRANTALRTPSAGFNLMAQAPSKVAFSGTYVHQYGGRMNRL